MTANGWSSAGNAYADALLDQLGDLEIAEERRRRLLRLAVTGAIALHALLLLVVPKPDSGQIVIPIPLRDIYVVAPTPRFTPPAAPAEPTPVRTRARRVPMPDPTPDEPEPIARDVETPAPELELPFDVGIGAIPIPPDVEPDLYIVDGKDVLPPVKTFAPDPVYPRAGQIARRNATVVLEAIIDANGTVTSLRPLTSIGLGFEDSALAAVRDWRFLPATKNGRPVPVLYQLTIRFSIAN